MSRPTPSPGATSTEGHEGRPRLMLVGVVAVLRCCTATAPEAPSPRGDRAGQRQYRVKLLRSCPGIVQMSAILVVALTSFDAGSTDAQNS
jgi:hypothetical protein